VKRGWSTPFGVLRQAASRPYPRVMRRMLCVFLGHDLDSVRTVLGIDVRLCRRRGRPSRRDGRNGGPTSCRLSVVWAPPSTPAAASRRPPWALVEDAARPGARPLLVQRGSGCWVTRGRATCVLTWFSRVRAACPAGRVAHGLRNVTASRTPYGCTLVVRARPATCRPEALTPVGTRWSTIVFGEGPLSLGRVPLE